MRNVSRETCGRRERARRGGVMCFGRDGTMLRMRWGCGFTVDDGVSTEDGVVPSFRVVVAESAGVVMIEDGGWKREGSRIRTCLTKKGQCIVS